MGQRTLILNMSFSGPPGMAENLVATFEDTAENVSTDEAMRGLAFGLALLYKHKIAGELDRKRFLGLMSAYVDASIDACNLVPDAGLN